jgi:multiple sugar transport system permease protein
VATIARASYAGQRGGRFARRFWRAAFYVVVVAVTALTMFPIYWMLLTAIQPTQFNIIFPPLFVPGGIDLTNFAKAFGNYPLFDWLVHSGGLGLLTTVICLTLSVMGAYPLASLRWSGRNAFGFFLFFTQMMPEAMIVIPIFVIYRQLHLTESLPSLALIDAAFTIPVGTWILKNVFDGVPYEVREAALVDGCGVLGVLWRIVLPLSGPGMVAVSVVAFFYAWNEYLFASTMITLDEIRPASTGLAAFITMGSIPIERILAGGLIFAIPPAIFFLITQRNIVTGLTAGAVKG